MSFAAVAFAAVAFVVLASASPAAPFGTYRGSMGEFTLESRAGGKVHLDFSLGIPGCAGGAEGDGVLEDDTFTYSEDVEGQEGPCVITIVLEGAKADVTSERCGQLHGASCEFDGEYRRVKRKH